MYVVVYFGHLNDKYPTSLQYMYVKVIGPPINDSILSFVEDIDKALTFDTIEEAKVYSAQHVFCGVVSVDEAMIMEVIRS